MKSCITDAFRVEALAHVSDCGAMIALYTRAAQFDRKTARYTSENEVVGTGYQAGGMKLTGGEIIETELGFVLTFHSPVWQNATITARGAVIYLPGCNNKVVRVMDFGRDIVSTNGPFTVQLPSAADGGVLGL